MTSTLLRYSLGVKMIANVDVPRTCTRYVPVNYKDPRALSSEPGKSHLQRSVTSCPVKASSLQF